jgi:hypothetical protein
MTLIGDLPAFMRPATRLLPNISATLAASLSMTDDQTGAGIGQFARTGFGKFNNIGH